MEPVEPVLKNIYQSNIYRKDLNWPHFDDEPRNKEKQEVNDQQSSISVFVACITILGSNCGHQLRCGNSLIQKIPENYCPSLYLSIGQVW